MAVVTRSEIAAAYRIILGRSPSQSEIEFHLGFGYPNLEALFNNFVRSQEFSVRFKRESSFGAYARFADGLVNVAGMTRPATVFLGDRVLTHTHLNQRIYVPPTDVDLAPRLFAGAIWEPHVLQTIETQVPKSSCALDIGANIGYHSLALARAVTHLGRVHAFEANPRLIPLLKSTFFVNGLNDLIRIHHLAVSDKPGVLELAQEPDHFGSGNIVPPGYEKVEAYHSSYSIKHQVIAKPLDSFLPDFGGSVQTIRMDIEGFEPQALYGAARLLEASPDIRIIAEWSVHMMAARTDLGAFVKWLEGQGFRFWLIEPNTANLVPLAGHETLGLPHSDVFISRQDPV